MPAKKSVYIAQRTLKVGDLIAFHAGHVVPDEHVEAYGYEVGKGKDVVKVAQGEPAAGGADDLEPNAT